MVLLALFAIPVTVSIVMQMEFVIPVTIMVICQQLMALLASNVLLASANTAVEMEFVLLA